MPPVRATTAAAAAGDLAEGTLVVAKVFGHAAWPARVAVPPVEVLAEAGRTRRSTRGKLFVAFVGDSSVAFVDHGDVALLTHPLTSSGTPARRRAVAAANKLLAALPAPHRDTSASEAESEVESEASSAADHLAVSTRPARRGKAKAKGKAKGKGKAKARVMAADSSEEEEEEEDSGSGSEGMEATPPNDMSGYEAQRLANIRRNQDLLLSLQLPAMPSAAAAAEKRAPPKKKATLKRKAEPRAPTRVSRRLRSQDPTGKDLPEPEPEPQYVDFLDGDLECCAALPPHRYRGNVAVDEELIAERQTGLRLLASLPAKPPARLPRAVMAAGKVLHHTIDPETGVGKAVRDRIFAMEFHPSAQHPVLFVGDKWGQLGVLAVDSGDTHVFQPHLRPISRIIAPAADPARVLTCSYEGNVRQLDVAKGVFLEVATTSGEDSLNGMALDAARSALYTVTSGGELHAIDLRSPAKATAYTLHDRKCGHVDINPADGNMLATASLDRTARLWDTRMLRSNKRSNRSTAQIAFSKAATSANFSPDGERLVTTSYDDTVRVWDDIRHSILAPADATVIRHNNQTGRWLTNFKAVFEPKNPDYVIVGSMGRPRGVDFFHCKTGRLHRYEHEELTSVVSVVASHPHLNLFCGGNSSGKVFTMRLGAVAGAGAGKTA